MITFSFSTHDVLVIIGVYYAVFMVSHILTGLLTPAAQVLGAILGNRYLVWRHGLPAPHQCLFDAGRCVTCRRFRL